MTRGQTINIAPRWIAGPVLARSCARLADWGRSHHARPGPPCDTGGSVFSAPRVWRVSFALLSRLPPPAFSLQRPHPSLPLRLW